MLALFSTVLNNGNRIDVARDNSSLLYVLYYDSNGNFLFKLPTDETSIREVIKTVSNGTYELPDDAYNRIIGVQIDPEETDPDSKEKNIEAIDKDPDNNTDGSKEPNEPIIDNTKNQAMIQQESPSKISELLNKYNIGSTNGQLVSGLLSKLPTGKITVESKKHESFTDSRINRLLNNYEYYKSKK